MLNTHSEGIISNDDNEETRQSMMLLTISDRSVQNAHQLTVSFESEKLTKQFVLDGFESPATSSFKQSLVKYLFEFPLAPEENAALSKVAEWAIQVGRNLGDELLGDNHELLHIKEIIEENGYHHLTVKIESDTHQQSDTPWELTVLPDSDFVLSSVTKSFSRVYPDTKPAEPLIFDLGVASAMEQNINTLLSPQTSPATGQGHAADKPLRILCHSPEGETARGLSRVSGDLINLLFKVTAQGGHFALDGDFSNTFEQLKEQLMTRQVDTHVFYYNGPIRSIEQHIEILIGDEWTDVRLVAELLGQHRVPLWFIAPSVPVHDDLSDGQKLSRISEVALTCGVCHVIGLAQASLPQIANHVFETFLHKLAEGHDLAQAVVETRKALQVINGYETGALQPVPLYVGPLLIHYGDRPVVFFARPNMPDAETMSQLRPLNERLFGFLNSMLPPLLFNSSDGQVLTLIKHIRQSFSEERGSLSVILGKAGLGKTHLSHIVCAYLALKKHIDHGFYFALGQDSLDPEQMLGMVKEVVQIEALETDVKAIAKLACCFVFDLSAIDQTILSAQWVSMIESLVHNGQSVIVITEQEDRPLSNANIRLSLQPMNAHDQRLLASHVLRQHTGSVEAVPASLMSALCGNPWLIKKCLPMLGAEVDLDEVNKQLKDMVLSDNQPLIKAFYAWQWQSLPEVWKKLLVLCKNTPGLLLEMIMMVCDQKQAYAPAKKLLTALGDSEAKVSEGLAVMEQAGFIDRFPHGRTIAADCLGFLHEQEQSNDRIGLLFSQVICEGVRSLVDVVLKQPNSSLSNNLIINRRHWAKHLERLWFGGEYEGFFSAVSGLTLLLKQAGIDNDLLAWKSDLLSRTEPFDALDDEQRKIAWLVMATSALNEGQSPQGVDFKTAAALVTDWLDPNSSEVPHDSLPLFQQSVLFLDAYHRSGEHWPQRVKVLNKAELVYLKHQAWHRLIWTWRALAHSWHELGDNDQSTAYEDKIIEEIPYEGSPAGFQFRQSLDVLLQRVARGELTKAQALLDELCKHQDSGQMQGILEGIQCDIHMGSGAHLKALPHYQKMWIRAAKYQQTEVTGQLLDKLRLIIKDIGEEAYIEHFESRLPDDVPRPSRQLFQ